MRNSENLDRKIVLEDGTEIYGAGFGCRDSRVAELVFNTSMVGYQEILSDPSYTDQAVVMTYPLIGNYGMAEADYETLRPTLGAFVVREYMENGTLNMDAAQEAEEEYNQIFEDMRDPEHNNIFDYSSVKKTSAEIIDYLGAVIEKGALSYQFAVRFPGYNPNNIDDSLEVYDISDEIEEAVNSEINDKYADVLQKEFRCYLFSSEDGYRKSYSIVRGALSYQEGQGASVPYTIHFVDNETEEEVGVQTGEGEPWREIDFEFPEYYSWITNRSYTVNEGSARNDSGRAFTITSLNPVDMTVQVRLKQIPCQITYVNDDTDEVVGTWEGMVSRGGRNEFEFPEGKWVVRELEVISGEAKLRGGDFEIEGREPVEMVVRIH